MEKLVLSVREAAKVLGISSTAMYNLVKVQGFPTIQIGNRLLVSASGLTRWLDAQAEIGYVGQK